jgi:carboxylesterase type B
MSAEKVGAAFAKAAGADSIKALRAVPAEKIIDVFNNDTEGKKFRTSPNVDGWVLPDEIRNIFAQGKQNDVPVIVGSNANEMSTLTVPAMVPKTIDEYRKRVEPLYGEAARDVDALYPVKSDADVPSGVSRQSTRHYLYAADANVGANDRDRTFQGISLLLQPSAAEPKQQVPSARITPPRSLTCSTISTPRIRCSRTSIANWPRR